MEVGMSHAETHTARKVTRAHTGTVGPPEQPGSVGRGTRVRLIRPSLESLRYGFGREAVLIAGAMVAYFAIRNQTVGGEAQASANAERIVDLEQSLHVAWEDAVQNAVLGSELLVTLTNWVYIWGHWPVILTAATVLYLYRRERYYLLRNALFVSGGIGFVFFALLPVAPPRLLDLGLVDTVTSESSSYRALQPPGLTNQYAAFPSLHVGWNLVVGIVLLLATAHLAVRLFAVAMPLAMGFAVIATANHFVLDVVGGAVVVSVGLAVALAIGSRGATATLNRVESAARPVDEGRRA
ncbi:MAG: phosphatase PAP2 family protein [Thermoleophilia bacterium]|nr:phosphatase PAP2 family protein [Thermoleophilia bacterium]